MRPMVAGLFASTCLLSIVSWYTTQQGMALYLSVWFSLLAATGIQASLVLVAWLIGFTRSGRALLIGVYAITATVSIAFSYVSLYTWFEARERPAIQQRRLYDTLGDAAGKTEALLVSAIAEGRRHALALDEMTAAEKAHGHIARAQDSDPYLAKVREAVAREAQTYADGYREGAGTGVRYTAFDRHAKLARQTVEQLEASRAALAQMRQRAKPDDPTAAQLRAFREVYDAVPWAALEETLHGAKVDRPAVPAYAEFVERGASGQEDLMTAFQELVTAPGGRHVFSLALAAFIDLVIFLLAYASGPYFFGSEERRWLQSAAAIDGLDEQVFAREFLRKLTAGPRGMARADEATLTPGERQFCLLLSGKRLAIPSEDERAYLIDSAVHENLLDAIATPGLPLRAQAGARV